MRHPLVMRVQHLAGVALLSAGCSFTFDTNTPVYPLVGEPPIESELQKLNNGPVYLSAIVLGADDAYWLALQEEQKTIRLLRLSPPEVEQDITADQFDIHYSAFFDWIYGMTPTTNVPRADTLQIVSAGQTTPPITFDFAFGAGPLVVGGADSVFTYSVADSVAPTDHYTIYQVDKSFQRDVKFQDVDDPQSLGGTFYNGDGTLFFDKSRCLSGCPAADIVEDEDPMGAERYELVGHSTISDDDYDLGPQPSRILLYEPAVDQRQFVTCGSNGLNIVPIIPSATNPAKVLDPDPCASEFFTYLRLPNAAGVQTLYFYYQIGQELRRVPIDGSAAPEKAFDRDIVRVLGVNPQGNVTWSSDPDTKYIYGVGDAYTDDWFFAQRGRLFYLSRDLTRMRWLEDAAQEGGIGTLKSIPFKGTGATTLADNVYDYDELDDGRLLAASNHAYRGIQNRIVIIDEKHGEARWVADRAADYTFIPGSTDLLVDIVTGASTSDLVRVPLPPDPYAVVDGGAD